MLLSFSLLSSPPFPLFFPSLPSLLPLLPSPSLSPALIGDSHVMGWGSKAIEIRAVENGQLDGVFMHKRTQRLRFLCERNDKVLASVQWMSMYGTVQR